MLTEMPKVGEKVRYVGGKFNDYVTLGHVYEINEINRGCAYFIDDDNDPNNRSIIRRDSFDCFVLVTESSPTILELLANIGRRLSEVEAVVARTEPTKDDTEVIDLSDSYPNYFKDVSGIDSIDVYKTHELFGIDDPSGAIQHASKKLLLSGARTGGKSKFTDIKEARDTLSRWLEINAMETEASE